MKYRGGILLSTTPFKQPVIPQARRESILKLMKRGERIDGRRLDEFRKINVILNPITRSEGSAVISIGNTVVMTGVKLETGAPYPDTPSEGVLQVHAEFVPLASPTFEPGPPDEDAIEAARIIDRSLRESGVVKLEDLVIVPGKVVWIVFNDLYLLDHDGNIVDAGMLSSILALNLTKIPLMVVENEKILVVREKWVKPLPINLNVVTTTIGVYEEYLVVDPTLDEELILDSKLIIAVDEKGRIAGLQKTGVKSISRQLFEQAVDLAIKKAFELHNFIKKTLNNQHEYIKPYLSIDSFWERK